MWRDEAYLLDILVAARKVLGFTKGVTWEEFQRNDLLQNAVMRPLEIIEEVARKVSQETKDSQPEIPWNDMIGMRKSSYPRVFPHQSADCLGYTTERHSPLGDFG